VSQNPPEQDAVDPSSKANATVDFHDRDAVRKTLPQFLHAVDVDALRLDSNLPKQVLRLIAQVTASPRIENDSVVAHRL